MRDAWWEGEDGTDLVDGAADGVLVLLVAGVMLALVATSWAL